MKRVLLVITIIAAIGFVAVRFAFRSDAPNIDTVAIHFAIQASMDSDSVQETVAQQTAFLIELTNEMDAVRRNRDNAVQIYLYVVITALAVGGVSLFLYYERKVLAPFRKLENFAHHIAAGNLDIPLEMDKDNIFGAFTESFDLMREELLRARENEIAASKSKKELVASLAHDINTPIASVRSAIDVLRLKAKDETDIKILDSASGKLEQIDGLITNLFHSTLEELQELKVNPIDVQNAEICDIIKQSDYDGRCRNFSIPDCLVLADLMRLRQVFDNIIKNSYKYANTDILIKSFIEEEQLFIEVKDFGAGVAEKELPLITSKFYRGSNTEKIDGHGLGLYLSKTLLERMSGGLYCENHDDGFVVVVMLRLAGVQNI